MAVVYPSVDGQAYTEPSGGRYTGDWQADVMSPVTGASETTAVSLYGVVDNQGRPVVYLPSAARTATPTVYTVYSRGATGLAVTLKATAASLTPSVVVTIQAYDAVTAAWTTLLTSAAITGVSTNRYVVAPEITEAANLAVSTTLPDTLRVVPTHGDTDPLTYSVSLEWTP